MRPTLRCMVVFAAGVPLALAAVAIRAKLWPVWFAYLCAVIALAGVDAILGLPKRRLRVTAKLPEQLYIGERGRAAM
jgi:hypothetical protein